MAAVPVGTLRSERGDLELAGVLHDNHDAERGPDGDGFREKAGDRSGGGACGDVIVGRFDAREHIPHAPAGEEGFVSGIAEDADNAEGGGVRGRRHASILPRGRRSSNEGLSAFDLPM